MQTSASLSTLTAAALIHEQHTHSHALSHDYTNAQTGLWPQLAHAHSVTHSGIIVVVKPEKKSERDIKTESGTETGETEGGKGTVIAQTEAFYPQAVFKCCHVRDPQFPPVDVVATNFFYMYFSTNKSNIWELLFVLQVFSVSVFVFKCLVKGCTAQQLTHSVFWRMWQTCSGVCCSAVLTFFSLCQFLTYSGCVFVCVCVFLLWSAALAQKEILGRPILCSASCRKLAANCGSMRRCCFVWSDKVQTKPSGLHWPAAVLSIVDWTMNVGLCDGWLVLNIRWCREGGGAGSRVHSRSFKMSPSVWSCCPLCLIVTMGH